MPRINRRTVDSLRLEGSPERWVWDTDFPGFGLRIRIAGLKGKLSKVYYVQYRTGGRGSPTRRVRLGAHPVLTADEARGEAKRVLAKVRLGGDPAVIRGHVTISNA